MDVPKPDDPGISSTIVEGVFRALRELGHDAPAPSGPIVAGPTADALLDAAASALSDEAIGLSAAKRLPIGSLGDLDYALVTSTTLREGLDRLVRYYGVVTQRVRLSLVEDGSVARLVFERDEAGGRHSRHWAEFATAMIAQRIRQTVGREVRLVEVCFRHGPPTARAAHDAFFGVPVRFEGDADSFAIERSLLDSALPTASAALAEVLEARLREVASERDVANATVDRVRRAIQQLLDEGKTGVEETAARLRTSPRTLQRELQQHGISHQQIVDEVRRERARHLLERGLSVADVATRLGFAEPSAFFRAFRRWTGSSPGALKKR